MERQEKLSLGLPQLPSESGVIEVNFDQLLPQLGREESAIVLGYCLEFANWRENIRSVRADLENLTAPIDMLIEDRNSQRRYVSEEYLAAKEMWVLGLFKNYEQEALFWKTRECPYEVSVIRLEDLNRAQIADGPTNDFEHESKISSPLGAIYRSIKRQIFRRYVYSHKKCLKQLLKLSRDEVRAIENESVCPIAAAYVIWRMSHEGVGNIEAFSQPRQSDYNVRFMAPDLLAGLPVRFTWSYISFNSIVTVLLENLGKHRLSVVLNRSSILCRGHVVFDSYEDTHPKRTHYVIHPKIDSLKFLANCHKARSSKSLARFDFDDQLRDFDYIPIQEGGQIVMQFQWPRIMDRTKESQSYWIEI